MSKSILIFFSENIFGQNQYPCKNGQNVISLNCNVNIVVTQRDNYIWALCDYLDLNFSSHRCIFTNTQTLLGLVRFNLKLENIFGQQFGQSGSWVFSININFVMIPIQQKGLTFLQYSRRSTFLRSS